MFEDKQMTESRFVAEGAILSCMAAILGVIGIYFPPLSLISNLIWLIPLIVVTMRWGFGRGMIALMVAGSLMAMLSSPVDALLLLVRYGGLALVYGYSFGKGDKLQKTLLRGILAAVLGSILMIVISMGVLGFEPATIVEEMQQASQMTISLYEETGMLAQFEEQGISREQIVQLIDRVGILMVKIIPSIMVVWAMLTAIFSLILTRSVLNRLRLKVPAKLPPFREWRVDFRYIYGFIAGLVAYLLADIIGIPMLSTVGLNLLVAFGFVFALQGMSVLVSLFHLLKGRTLGRVMLILSVLLFMQTAVYLLVFIGLFDVFFDYRKRFDRKGDNHESNTQ
jgi:uncharacterized protein YybS (DUF2232 family)